MSNIKFYCTSSVCNITVIGKTSLRATICECHYPHNLDSTWAIKDIGHRGLILVLITYFDNSAKSLCLHSAIISLPLTSMTCFCDLMALQQRA